ncbi:hypothetical protein Vp2S01_p10051 (plasmid) [Vibrio parahaemolyticus]|nr:hypothetical protein Vp2S01_p10051 [Vibrio parahaemolyticus]ETZ12117.1 hypothetical protein AJ90_21140 [Vibrio parahaemolyticus M0605]
MLRRQFFFVNGSSGVNRLSSLVKANKPFRFGYVVMVLMISLLILSFLSLKKSP